MRNSGSHFYKKKWSDKITLLKLLASWHSSVFQLLWLDLFIYVSIYYIIAIVYRVLLLPDPHTRGKFEDFVKYCQAQSTFAPLTFLLGFFVTHILTKWWDVVLLIPWINDMAVNVHTVINCTKPEDEEAVSTLRRTLLRYMNMAFVIGMRPISDPIQKRFACKVLGNCEDLDKEVQEGETSGFNTIRYSLEPLNRDADVKDTFGFLISETEMKAFEKIRAMRGKDYFAEYEVPINWAFRLIRKAKEAKFIDSDPRYAQMLVFLDEFRHKLRLLWIYDTHANSVVYIQVVIIAVYSYFLLTLFSSQVLVTDKVATTAENIAFYCPIFVIMKFLFYMGWFKIGYSLMDPMKDNPIDIPTGDLVTMNLKVSTHTGKATPDMFPKWLQELAEAKQLVGANLAEQTAAAGGVNGGFYMDESDPLYSKHGRKYGT